MSSTRNKNTPGDYKLEQNINTNIDAYKTYTNYGVNPQTYLSGDGLLPAKQAREKLCNNYTDVESELFGIGTTNLVTPKPLVTPELKGLQSLSIIDRTPLIIPEPLVIHDGQRPFYLN